MNVVKGIINLFRFDRTNWKAVVLCFIAATVFWFFNALNKEHTATVAYPIQFRFDHTAFVATKTLPEKVQLNITGTGWDLLRKSVGFKLQPLRMDLGQPSGVLKIGPNSVLSLASTQLQGTKINFIANDTLQIAIEPRKQRKVKLFINQKRLRFELGFGQSSEIKFSPDSVSMDGPASVISQLGDSVLVSMPPARLSQNVRTEIKLQGSIANSVVFTPGTISVRFEVSELKDEAVLIPVTPVAGVVAPDSVRAIIRYPKKNPEKDFKTIAANIATQHLAPGRHLALPQILGLPPFAEIVHIDSIQITKIGRQ